MTMTSPKPWRVQPKEPTNFWWTIRDADGFKVGEAHQSEGDARDIVRAVNCFDELVDACESAHEFFARLGNREPVHASVLKDAHDKVVAALSRVRGERE